MNTLDWGGGVYIYTVYVHGRVSGEYSWELTLIENSSAVVRNAVF